MLVPSRLLTALAAGFAALCVAAPCFGESATFRGYRELLGSHYAKAERIEILRVRPDDEERARLEKRLRAKLAQADYIFHVAKSGGGIIGYAHLGRAPTRFSTFSFAVLFDRLGLVSRTEVIEYPETHGSGIRSRAFLRQFTGRDGRSGFRLGRDVDAVTGASISSRSLCEGVRRATVLLDELVLGRASARADR